jgi:hypothetical protein
VQQSSSTANLDNEQTDEQVNPNNNDLINKHNQDKLLVHYTHEKRFESFKRDMHRLYNDTFGPTPGADAKLIVGTRNRRDSQNELIRKRPDLTQSTF